MTSGQYFSVLLLFCHSPNGYNRKYRSDTNQICYKTESQKGFRMNTTRKDIWNMNVPPEGKASQNKRRKRESLLNNAFELFTQKGITDTTISDIVEKAGVAKGTFYLYFKDKYDLRDRLVRHKAELILEKAYEALSEAARTGSARLDTLEDKVVFFSDNILTQLSEDRVLLKFITKNLSWAFLKRDVSTLDAPDCRNTSFADRLQAYFSESAVKYRNPEVLLYMIVEFIGSTCYSAVIDGEPMPFDKIKPEILTAVRAIMRSQEKPAS